MKSLKEALLNKPKNIDVAWMAIEEYINNNYNIEGKLSFKNVNGTYIVNCDGDVIVKNKDIGKLTDGFVWGEVKGDFYCSYCKNLISLEGAPEKIHGLFNCSCCINKGNSLFQNIYFLTCVSKHYLSFIMSIITVD